MPTTEFKGAGCWLGDKTKTRLRFHWNAPAQYSQVRIRGKIFIVRSVRPFFGPLCLVGLIEKIV
ncbi:MAG: hypothetical protein V7609_2111 [Verrucomicrobiota bacterium]